MEDRPNRLLTLIPWTLERLLRQEYELTLDSFGAPQTLEVAPAFGVLSTETMEEDLKACLPWEKLKKLFALRDHRTPEQVREALAAFPLLEFWLGSEVFEKLLRAEWPEIVGSVYRGLRRHDDFLQATIASRIGLGGSFAAEFETDVQWRRPDALPKAVAEYVVREMIESFPRIVERLNAFQVTPVTGAVPSTVAEYAREASRCFLNGFFGASLILCRSCINRRRPPKRSAERCWKKRERCFATSTSRHAGPLRR